MPPGGHLNITEVRVTFDPPDTLTITGEDLNFSLDPKGKKGIRENGDKSNY